mgnify:CR=1 FL=1|tara:strand:- start:13941 stop:14366 length:426 start_codon:yes stop_codon:yes gene_type:complete
MGAKSEKANAFDSAFDESAGEFEVLPEGTYSTRLLEVTTEANPFDEVQQTTLTYEIADGLHSKRRIWDSCKHEDNVAWKAARVYRSFGLQGKPDDWSEWCSAVNGCIGKEFDVTLIHRQNNDGTKTYVNVQRVVPSDNIPF